MFLFFDTETTGKPRQYRAPVTDLENWPRLVQLAWVLTDAEGQELDAQEFIIRPDGFDIPEDAARVHGISTIRARVEGVPIHGVLLDFTMAIDRADTLVAHNMSFDEPVMGAEFLRAGLGNPVPIRERLCTMERTTDFCRLPGRYGYKWPTLDELHRTLFDEAVDGAHQALVDVRACARCFFELKRRQVL
jgi:DNA polymerase-3 subunit epsilon